VRSNSGRYFAFYGGHYSASQGRIFREANFLVFFFFSGFQVRTERSPVQIKERNPGTRSGQATSHHREVSRRPSWRRILRTYSMASMPLPASMTTPFAPTAMLRPRKQDHIAAIGLSPARPGRGSSPARRFLSPRRRCPRKDGKPITLRMKRGDSFRWRKTERSLIMA